MSKLTKFILEELDHKLTICYEELSQPHLQDEEGTAYYKGRADAIEAVLADPTYATLAKHPAAIDALEDARDIWSDNIDSVCEVERREIKADVAKFTRAINHAKRLQGS